MKRAMLAAVAALALIGSGAAAAEYHAPKNAFGQPDLQGVWTNASLTSLERPAMFKSLTISEAQAKAFEQSRANMRAAADKPSDPTAGAPPVANDPGGYNAAWTDPGTALGRIKGEVRTSWLTDPADGKLPYSAEGRKTFERVLKRARSDFGGPEIRPLGERCILGFGSSAGPPMLNVLYNNNYQIVQTPEQVAIVVEMNHDVRTIRLNAKTHLPPTIRPWMGDSIGRWEGETLVVETTNFNPGESLRPYFGATMYLSKDARVTERFTRVSPTQILYQFAVEDPSVFSQVWRGEMPLNATKGPVYEYACHEGNYALPGILAGARQAEKEGKAPEEIGLSE
jgi:hypothetical protein